MSKSYDLPNPSELMEQAIEAGLTQADALTILHEYFGGATGEEPALSRWHVTLHVNAWLAGTLMLTVKAKDRKEAERIALELGEDQAAGWEWSEADPDWTTLQVGERATKIEPEIANSDAPAAERRWRVDLVANATDALYASVEVEAADEQSASAVAEAIDPQTIHWELHHTGNTRDLEAVAVVEIKEPKKAETA